MVTRKLDSKYAGQVEKDVWHRLDLQDLRDDKFIYVANNILKGRFIVVGLKSIPVMQS